MKKISKQEFTSNRSYAMTACYTFDEVLQMFGNNLAMFGELMVGTPACEYAWACGDLDVEANNILFVPGKRGRNRLLFVCLEIAKPRRWDEPDINIDIMRDEQEQDHAQMVRAILDKHTGH